MGRLIDPHTNAALHDPLGRCFPYLRLSVTEACNFKCRYCLPGGMVAAGGRSFLSAAEIGRLVAAFAELGVRKVRVTGGEPTLRTDLGDIIRAIAATPAIGTVALTTNGVRLKRHARAWRAAGVTALNLSLDSLDPKRFAAITGSPGLAAILAGLDEALVAGFETIKINVVLMRGLNDRDLDGYLSLVERFPISVRFIELMRTGDNGDFYRRHHIDTVDVERWLIETGWTVRPREETAGPALVYARDGTPGTVGLITPTSAGFCADCNRLRVTAGGRLRLCLFGDGSRPLRPLLQSDAQRPCLKQTIREALAAKPPGHRLNQGHWGDTAHLAAVGG